MSTINVTLRFFNIEELKQFRSMNKFIDAENSETIDIIIEQHEYYHDFNTNDWATFDKNGFLD